MNGHAGARPSRVDDEETALVERLYLVQSTAAGRAHHRASDERGDLIHDAFVRLLALGPDRLRALAGEKPAAYLSRITKHLRFDRAKRDLRRSAALHVPIDEVEIADRDLGKQLEARDALRRVERAIQAMRPRTRAIFIAHRVNGMSYVEIAETCGIGVKGVEKQMSRALSILAREMDGSDNG